MNNFNFFERKFRTLESFYMWVEQGSSYDVAFGQCIYYDTQVSELDDIITIITIATRFARTKREISDRNKSRIMKMIDCFNKLDLSKYSLNEYEIKVLQEEISEVETHFSNT
jgi:hypothetical protein